MITCQYGAHEQNRTALNGVTSRQPHQMLTRAKFGTSGRNRTHFKSPVETECIVQSATLALFTSKLRRPTASFEMSRRPTNTPHQNSAALFTIMRIIAGIYWYVQCYYFFTVETFEFIQWHMCPHSYLEHPTRLALVSPPSEGGMRSVAPRALKWRAHGRRHGGAAPAYPHLLSSRSI